MPNEAEKAMLRQDITVRERIARTAKLLQESTRHVAPAPKQTPSEGGDVHAASRQLKTGQNKQQNPMSPTDSEKGRTAFEKVNGLKEEKPSAAKQAETAQDKPQPLLPKQESQKQGPQENGAQQQYGQGAHVEDVSAPSPTPQAQSRGPSRGR